MITVSRRAFIQALASAPLALWSTHYARAQKTLLIRHDASSAAGLEMLRIYADAVAAMHQRGDGDPLSWVWQHYTHFVNGSTTKAAEITRIFGSAPSARSALAGEMWNTCQSHAGQNANHFLPWHRMYVLFFENIIRQVSGRPDFTLPYWNYTSNDPALRGVVPEAFRLPNDPVYGILYRPDRIRLANRGQPIHKNQPGDAMDIGVAMAKASYSSAGGVQGFCRAIDSGIHGKIHVLVGNRYNMGKVPYAARDPLFWVHHANIDRMWASWNRNGGVNPATPAWARRQFVFADTQGQRVSTELRAYFDMESLGYSYDDFIPAPASARAASLARQATTSSSAADLVARARPMDLGNRATRTTLRPIAGTPQTEVLGLATAGRSRRTYLILKDLHAWDQPEVLYHVYLTPRDGTLGPDNFVGSINFFDAEFHDHGGSRLDEALGENFFSFDVTDILLRIAGRRHRGARDALLVAFVPGGRPRADARPLVASIELVRQ
ncbi:MAG: tyrosinase family protein [Lysobacter sp.]